MISFTAGQPSLMQLVKLAGLCQRMITVKMDEGANLRIQGCDAVEAGSHELGRAYCAARDFCRGLRRRKRGQVLCHRANLTDRRLFRE
jgi:hypothetical protein